MKFLERLLRCPHRFTWPRMDAFGRYYQICLDCGTEYEYDWNLMRQTKRLEPLPSVAAAANTSDNSATWSSR